jgi:hypothetical protein
LDRGEGLDEVRFGLDASPLAEQEQAEVAVCISACWVDAGRSFIRDPGPLEIPLQR